MPLLQWTCPSELHGIGKYAADAYYMFCRGQWEGLQPADKELKKHHEWLKTTQTKTAELQVTHWANQQLNDEQKIAVRHVVSGRYTPRPYLIFGPPGTGKTSTVLEATAVQVLYMGNSLDVVASQSTCVVF